MIKSVSLAGLLLAGLATFAGAQEVRGVTHTLGAQRVTVYDHDFLSAEEKTTLQLVAGNEQALALFVTKPGRHAAMAVAPGDGFIRGGQPVASAVALSDFEDQASARKAVLEACNKAKASRRDCLLVLEVAPGR